MKVAVQEKTDTNPEIWNARQVAEYLNISLKSVYQGCEKGNIPHAIIGEKIFRFSREKIVNLV